MAAVSHGPASNTMYGGLRYNSVARLANALTPGGRIPPGEIGSPGLRPSTVQVIGILRYIPDGDALARYFKFSLKGKDSLEGQDYEETEMYDFVISDGLQRARVVLHPCLNKFVRSGAFNLLVHINCSVWKHVIVEHVRVPVVMRANVESHRIEIVTNFNTAFGTRSRASNKAGIHYHPALLATDERGLKTVDSAAFWRRPLVPGRSLYVSMSSDDCLNSALSMPMPYSSLDGVLCQHLIRDPEDGRGIREHTIEGWREILRTSVRPSVFVDIHWLLKPNLISKMSAELYERFSKNPGTLENRLSDAISSMQQASRTLASGERKSTTIEHPLVGMVTCKSAIQTKFTNDSTSRTWAHFAFDLTDATGTVRVTCWNELCRLVHSIVQPGALVYINNARLKRYGGAARSNILFPDYEISLELSSSFSENLAKDLLAQAFVLPVARDSDESVPNFQLDGIVSPDDSVSIFAEVQQLARETLAAKAQERKLITVCGLLTFVGRREILCVQRGTRFEFRWIKIADPETSEELVMQMYANSDPDNFMNITAGTWMVATRVRVCAQLVSSTHPVSILLRSTRESLYFLTKVSSTQTLSTRKSSIDDGKAQDALHGCGGIEDLERLLPRTVKTLREKVIKWLPALANAAIIYEPMIPKVAVQGGPIVQARQTRARRRVNADETIGPAAFVPQTPADFIFLKNPSQELDLRERTTISLLYSPNILSLRPRFEPLTAKSVADLQKIDFHNSMLVGQTQHFRVQAFIQAADIQVKRKSSSMTYLSLMIGTDADVDKGESFEALMKRNPIFAPCPTRAEMINAKIAFENFQHRLPSIDLNLAINEGLAVKCHLWVQTHKISYDEIEFEVIGELDARFYAPMSKEE